MGFTPPKGPFTRPSLPYQGIARRMLSARKIVYSKEIDITSAVIHSPVLGEVKLGKKIKIYKQSRKSFNIMLGVCLTYVAWKSYVFLASLRT